MNLKTNPKLDVLQLAKRLKTLKEEGDKSSKFETELTKFEEAFALPFKLNVSMKKILQEILQQKEISYKHSSFKDKIKNQSWTEAFNQLLKNEEVQIDDFKIFNVTSVKVGYDKYTMFSKKELFYVINFEHIATVRQYEKMSIVNILNTDYYESLVKLSKNMNEYYETEVTVSGDRQQHISEIQVEKIEFDQKEHKSYYINDDTYLFIEDVFRKIDKASLDNPQKIKHYTSSSYDGY